MIRLSDLNCENCMCSRNIKGKLMCVREPVAAKCPGDKNGGTGCYQGYYAVRWIGEPISKELMKEQDWYFDNVISWYEYFDMKSKQGLLEHFELVEKE